LLRTHDEGGQGKDDGDDETLNVDGSGVLGVSREIRDLNRGRERRERRSASKLKAALDEKGK